MGNNIDEPTTDTEPTPEDSFTLLGNEIRLEIIRVLGDARAQEDTKPVLSFSELRSQIENDPDPGQLRYHLKQLDGHFIEKINEGYTTLAEGSDLYFILRAGVFDRGEERMSVDAGFDCYYCQAPVEAWFSKRKSIIECPDCGFRYLTGNVAPPPGAFEGETAAFEQFSNYIHHTILGYARDICNTCGNVMRTKLTLPEGMDDFEQDRSKVYAYRSCDYCGNSFFLRVGVALLVDPELRSFCYDHGIDILTTPYWELEFAATDKHVTVRSTDHWEVALTVILNGDTLELVVDGDLNVVECNRLATPDDRSTSLLASVQSSVRGMASGESGDGSLLFEREDCLQILRRHRWPGEVACPHCDSTDTIKKGTTGKGAQRYRCHDCGSVFNDLTGTVFAEHRLTLPEMFYIIREMDKGETAQIAGQINRSHRAVLNFVREVQDARDEDSELITQ